MGRLRAAFLPGAFERDAPLAAAGTRLPVIVYFGGWLGTGIDNNELIRALVGEGFVVAATNAERGARRNRWIFHRPRRMRILSDEPMRGRGCWLVRLGTDIEPALRSSCRVRGLKSASLRLLCHNYLRLVAGVAVLPLGVGRI
jgi:hypothetical protein